MVQPHSLKVLSETFPPSKGANKNPPRAFYTESFYIKRVSCRKNPSVFQRFDLEPTQETKNAFIFANFIEKNLFVFLGFMRHATKVPKPKLNPVAVMWHVL